MHHDSDPLRQRLTSAIRETSAANAEARAPDTLRRTIARRRGAFHSSMGALAVIALGAMAAAGFGFTDRSEPPVTPTVSPTPDFTVDGARDYAVVPLPTEREMRGDFDVDFLELCGKPAPSPSASAEAFIVGEVTPGQLNLSRDLRTLSEESGYSISFDYRGADPLPAFIDGPMGLLVQDGEVRGFAYPNRSSAINTFTTDQTRTFPWTWQGWVEGCDEYRSLPAGDYEVVFVTTVHNDLESAALWSLFSDGYTLPTSSSIAAFREGSYLCEQWSTFELVVPLTCAPNAVVGFEMDEESNSATIPYNPSLYSRDVSLTFVSEPVPATLGEESTVGRMQRSGPTYEAGVVPACGDIFGYVDSPLYARWPAWDEPRHPGDTLIASLWPEAVSGWGTAVVEMPTNPRVWLMREYQLDAQVEEGESATTTIVTFGYKIVGWMDTGTGSQSTVDISVYDGPADWSFSVTDFGWCDGYDHTADNSALSAAGYTGLLATRITAAYDDGTTEESAGLVLMPSVPGFE